MLIEQRMVRDQRPPTSTQRARAHGPGHASPNPRANDSVTIDQGGHQLSSECDLRASDTTEMICISALPWGALGREGTNEHSAGQEPCYLVD